MPRLAHLSHLLDEAIAQKVLADPAHRTVKQMVDFTVSKEDRTYWSSATRSWVEDASQFDIRVGADSTATLHETFSVKQ